MVHFEPIVYTVRWYEDGDSFEEKSPFKTVATVNVMNGDTVFVSGFHGTVTRLMLREFVIWLEDHGVKYVFAFRKGIWKQYNIQKYFRFGK